MAKITKGTKEELERITSEFIAFKILEIQRNKDRVVLGISGGESVSGVFKNLLNKDIFWGSVHIFMVDEIMKDLDDDKSNFKQAKENFIDELVESGDLPKENVHPFYYEVDVKNYNEELEIFGGKFDIVLLSSGDDGSVAGLFPNLTIKNKDDGFFVFDNSPGLPKERMTASRNLIKKSDVGILLFFEEDKAFEQFQDEQVEINDCPAKIINEMSEGYVFVSED